MITLTHIVTVFYLSQIEAILRDVGLDRSQVLVVDSVEDWARGVGIEVASPFLAAMATTRRSDGMPTITLSRIITADVRDGIISGIEVRGLGELAEEVDRIREPLAFLEHLVLHEAAHLLLPDATELECDQWAFDRLEGRISVLSRRSGQEDGSR